MTTPCILCGDPAHSAQDCRFSPNIKIETDYERNLRAERTLLALTHEMGPIALDTFLQLNGIPKDEYLLIKDKHKHLLAAYDKQLKVEAKND